LKPNSTVQALAGEFKHIASVREVRFTPVLKADRLGASVLKRRSSVESLPKPASSEDKQKYIENHLLPSIPEVGKEITAANIEKRMQDLGVPGACIAVINGGEVKWSSGYGEMKTPILVQAASVSKSVTALTILSLVDECQQARKEARKTNLAENATIDLDTDISSFINEDLWSSIDPQELTRDHPFIVQASEKEYRFQLVRTSYADDPALQLGRLKYIVQPENQEEMNEIRSLLQQALPKAETLTGLSSNLKSLPSVTDVKFTSHEMTIRRLLSHTAGTTVSGFDGYERLENIQNEIIELEDQLRQLEGISPTSSDQNSMIAASLKERLKELHAKEEQAFKGKIPNTEGIIKGEGNHPAVRVASTPGTEHRYSGGGTIILQHLIEILTGKEFAVAVEEHVLKKLNMDQSTYRPEESWTIHGNDHQGVPLPGRWLVYPELAAAGLWTTPEELAMIAISIQQSLQGKGLISRELAKEMLTSQTPDKPDGLGVFVETTPHTTYFFHQGSNQGFRCCMLANSLGQGAVVMTNSEYGESLIDEVFRSIATEYDWPGWETLPMFKPKLNPDELAAISTFKPLEPDSWENYAGVYQFEDHCVRLSLVDGTVVIQIDQDEPFVITPITDEFALFQRTNPGPVQILRMQKENEKGPYVLNLFGADHIKR